MINGQGLMIKKATPKTEWLFIDG